MLCKWPVIQYNEVMEKKTLAQTNPHLQDSEKALRHRARSIASSTAIETGESIAELEEKVMKYQKEMKSQSRA